MEKLEAADQRSFDFQGPHNLEKLNELLGSLGKGLGGGDKNLGESSKEQTTERESCKKQTDTMNNSNGSGSEPNILEREILYTKTSDAANSKEPSADGTRKKLEDFSSDPSYQVPNARVIGRVEMEIDFQSTIFYFVPCT